MNKCLIQTSLDNLTTAEATPGLLHEVAASFLKDTTKRIAITIVMKQKAGYLCSDCLRLLNHWLDSAVNYCGYTEQSIATTAKRITTTDAFLLYKIWHERHGLGNWEVASWRDPKIILTIYETQNHTMERTNGRMNEFDAMRCDQTSKPISACDYIDHLLE